MNSREKIEDAKGILRDNGYCVDSLWSIHDVHAVVECTDKQAMEIMYNALNNESTTEQIWFTIKDYALINKFKLKNDSDF